MLVCRCFGGGHPSLGLGPFLTFVVLADELQFLVRPFLVLGVALSQAVGAFYTQLIFKLLLLVQPFLPELFDDGGLSLFRLRLGCPPVLHILQVTLVMDPGSHAGLFPVHLLILIRHHVVELVAVKPILNFRRIEFCLLLGGHGVLEPEANLLLGQSIRFSLEWVVTDLMDRFLIPYIFS